MAPRSRRMCLLAAVAWLGAPLTALARPGRYGPFATARRAQEVANRFKADGWRAAFFHDGDGWYVDVRR
ncbi:MAG: hypothetical protein JNK55_22975 [Rubrivivax sp.]|nr:hypothetical protein [Rubrivivax sp.]